MASDVLIKLDDGSEFYLGGIDHLEVDKLKGTFRFVMKTGKTYSTDKDTFYYFIEKYNLNAVLRNLG